jgi:hypothetical protein
VYYVQAFSVSGGHRKWFTVKIPDEAAMEAAIIRESLSLTKQIRFDTEHHGVILVSQPP